ncbi:bifunctional diguanylate cyclase/phosphodiesterase [Nitrincola tapanii]|uniref:cyclic-guanylate-specific phosphodiesterase n=1 Tax=Nitrincola tapanii TaxID=1708751 RepID=A0A5A9W8Q6_9GAMM|nr:EAL domain-containing protein [Nitrincola tapanii]KAA0876508.1 EAL domain-containing protein [Nitrincola tapanii]
MQLSDQARTLPRLHLIGTLLIISCLTLMLSGFFTWHKVQEHNASIQRIEAAVSRQIEARLQAEMETALESIHFIQQQADAQLKMHLREQVDQAWSIAQSLYTQSQSLPVAEQQRLIVEALRPARFFEERGYYFIDDMSGRFILLPTAPEFEGQLLPDNQDDRGHFIMQGLIEAARLPEGEGYSRYRWYRPDDPSRMADKLAYVRYFEPFDWLIGAGDYTYEWEKRQQYEMLMRLRTHRIGLEGYIAILDRSGQVLLSVDSPHLEQDTPAEYNEQVSAALALMLQTANAGGGYLRYLWRLPDQEEPVWKTAWVESSPFWDWILVATLYEDEAKGILQSEMQAFEQALSLAWKDYLLVMMLTLGLALLGSLGFSRWSGRLFAAYHAERHEQQQRLAEQAEALKESESKLATILDSVEAYIFIKDCDYRYTYVNHKVEQIFAQPREAILGQGDAQFFSPESARLIAEQDTRVLQRGERVATEEQSYLISQDAWHTFLTVKLPLRRENGEIYALCGIATDISERKVMEDQIRHLAFYDALTGLANRRLLLDRLQQQLKSQMRHQELGALLFIDLDNFKTLNDTLGHDVGDQLLIQVGQRLGFCVREEDTVARFGGDEFVVMLSHLTKEELKAAAKVREIAEKILDTLRQSYRLGGKAQVITPSIGITLFAGQASAEELLKQADLAMYKAKESGRNRLHFFDPTLQTQVLHKAQLEHELRHALQTNECVLFYQPQVDAQGRILGAEALIRWLHPQRGLVMPAEFIPIAEASGLILDLGHWVLEAACRQLQVWQTHPVARDWVLAINISAHQFRQNDFVESLIALTQKYAIPAERLKLELTESVLIDDIQFAIERMHYLKAAGFGFALDDFGTGYSSLAYIKQLPLDQIKIDRCFIDGLPLDSNDAAITRIIIRLAQEFNLQVIAEGVETQAQRDFLLEAACVAFQGYWFGRPMPADEFLSHALAQEGV